MIKSSQSVAHQKSFEIKSPSIGADTSVLTQPAQVTVTVHGECLSAYNEGISLLMQYQGLADRDADSIESLAAIMQEF